MDRSRLFRLDVESRGDAWRARVLTGIQRFRFFKGELLAPSRRPYLVLAISQDAEVLPDVLLSDRGVLLVHERIGKVFERLCPFDVQLVRVELHTRTGRTDSYQALNVLCRQEIAQLENSLEFRPVTGGRVYFLTHQTVRPDLSGHLIAQDGRSQYLYVTDPLKRALEHQQVTGLTFKLVKEM